DTAQVMVDFTQMKSFGQEPLILERGEGIRVTDVFGQTYIDGLSGVFTVNLGHGVQHLIDIAAEQARKIAFTAPTMATNPPALRLAELLIDITPAQYTTVKFFSGGSEATESAIKLARQFWMQSGHQRKYKVISRYRSYHGGTGHAMAASAQTAWKWKFEPFAPGFIHVTPPARPGCAACRCADACTLACLDLMEQAIVEEHPETVAAVIAEPVMLSAGVHVPHPEYFPRLRELCDRHNVLLIYDEIITGFGRTGRLFGAERVGAWPDILSCGKGISGGYAPLSAILIADRISEAFWGEPEAGVQFWAGHTFGGNPVACAVGEAAVRYLLDQDLIGNAERVGDYLAGQLDAVAARQPAIAEVRGIGMLRGVAFTQPIGQAVYDAARRGGLLTRPGADWVGIAPPLCTTKEEVDEIVSILETAVSEVVA
ncbi:MAG TPA: aspartate aminotransferase family protein, partial [Thermomicrobiales bacterium]|nr:aspartate aminotransferase family protein [Thermomicrobiales bacterium]